VCVYARGVVVVCVVSSPGPASPIHGTLIQLALTLTHIIGARTPQPGDHEPAAGNALVSRRWDSH
jgi:hypothetical protein